jgi:hypothetical protein
MWWHYFGQLLTSMCLLLQGTGAKAFQRVKADEVSSVGCLLSV